MTRRHFAAIAAVFSDLLDDVEMDRTTVLVTIRRLIPVFKWANSGFNVSRFCEAAGTSEEEVRKA